MNAIQTSSSTTDIRGAEAVETVKLVVQDDVEEGAVFRHVECHPYTGRAARPRFLALKVLHTYGATGCSI